MLYFAIMIDYSTEKEVIVTQKGLYGMGPTNRYGHYFNYDIAQITPGYKSQVLDPFIKSLSGEEPLLVLELGSGKGEANQYMGRFGIKVVGLDLCTAGLKGQRNPVVATAWKLPFIEDSFDGIYSKDMMTHIPTGFRGKLFSELQRVIKPDGVVLICSAKQRDIIDYQYPTSAANLIILAKYFGFKLKGIKRWRPERDFNDWYRSRRSRFVLELRKTIS